MMPTREGSAIGMLLGFGAPAQAALAIGWENGRTMEMAAGELSLQPVPLNGVG